MKCFRVLLALILALWVPAQAASDLEMADDYLLYSVHWNGSAAAGPIVSIAVPETTNATKATYIIGVEVYAESEVTVAITKDSATHPTTTAVVPTPLNTTIPAEFRGYTNSNAGFGSVVTQRPASQYHLIMLEGVKFGTGKKNARNINVHIGAAAVNVFVTWKVAQK